MIVVAGGGGGAIGSGAEVTVLVISLLAPEPFASLALLPMALPLPPAVFWLPLKPLSNDDGTAVVSVAGAVMEFELCANAAPAIIATDAAAIKYLIIAGAFGDLFVDLILHRIGERTFQILRLPRRAVGLAFDLQFCVAEDPAGDFFDHALDLFGRSGNSILVHN